ncbi:MAG: glycoside hydrolase family 16 protein [Chitinophagaceae bacterium]|nr:MAG: glycoside hydrolase family 16 protein [Chitinophagaceae bacterium]
MISIPIKLKTILLLILACFLFISSNAQSQRWKLIWQDEFSKDGIPDSSKWSFAGRGKSPWDCYCYNDTAASVVKDGRLLLKGIVSGGSSDTVHYQTGCITTKNKFFFQYGKLVVRAKLPQAQGSWPAIWLLPETNKHGGWPEGGEIDVMEHLNHDSIVYQTMHSYYIDKLHHESHPEHFSTAFFHPGKFNTFGMEWYPDRIDFFVNGHKIFSYPKIKDDTTGTQWPFDQPFYILLDQALGGWPGKINNAELPATMEVDWVRVYKRD